MGTFDLYRSYPVSVKTTVAFLFRRWEPRQSSEVLGKGARSMALPEVEEWSPLAVEDVMWRCYLLEKCGEANWGDWSTSWDRERL